MKIGMTMSRLQSDDGSAIEAFERQLDVVESVASRAAAGCSAVARAVLLQA